MMLVVKLKRPGQQNCISDTETQLSENPGQMYSKSTPWMKDYHLQTSLSNKFLGKSMKLLQY